MRITSAANARVKQAARLRDRQGRNDQSRIIIEGVREISRAIEAGVQLIEVFYCPDLFRPENHALLPAAERLGAELLEVTRPIMEKLAYGDRAEGMLAVARTPSRTLADLSLPVKPLVAVIERVEKPGNLGAIVRSADAAGVSAVVVADGETDLYNPHAIRASLGAIFTVPVCAATSADTLTWLIDQSIAIWTARVDAETDYWNADLSGPAAIVLGSEARGLSSTWSGENVRPIRLPLLGRIDSLNLSATAAVLFYEALRQRRLGNR